MKSFVVVALVIIITIGCAIAAPIQPTHNYTKTNLACPTSPLRVGQTRIETVHDGVRREYIVHIPTGYNNTQNLPLVFDIHGYTNTGETQARLSGFRDIADREHFIVVNPEGTGALQSWNGGDCCVGNNEDDLGFFLRMIEEISSEHACIDLNRVYAGGYSNGGFMSHYLACNAAEHITAIGPAAGTITLPCRPSRTVPVWHVHGTDDRTIPYEGNFAYEGAEDSQDAWTAANGCSNQNRVVYQSRQTECTSYWNCPLTGTNTNVESVLCTVEGGSHDYDFTSEGINTAETSWEFYKRFSIA